VKKNETKLSKFLRRKISTKKVETSGVAALTFGDLIYDMARVDQRYIDGVDFSRPSKDLSSVFKIGKENISESPETLNILHERNYSGYTHEFVTHQWARNRGEEVEIPKKFNQPGYDAIYNGEKFQIKFNNVDAIREHRLKYPDIKVRSDIETAEAYKEKFPEDVAMVFGTTPKALTADMASEGKAASMEVFENEELFDTGVPEVLGIAALIPLVKNVSYIHKNETNFESGIRNIAIDAVGRGSGMFIAGAVGSLFLGPVGIAIAAIGGGLFGKGFSDAYKLDEYCSEEKDQMEDALHKYIVRVKEMLNKNIKTFREKIKKLKSTLGYEVYRKKVFNENNMSKELYEFLINRMKKELKEKNIILGKLEMASPTKYWKEYETSKDYSEFMEDYKNFKDENGEKYEIWGGAHFAKWLNFKKFEDEDEELKLPEIANEAEKISRKAGIGIDFLKIETEYLIESIQLYVKALKKAGF
jgi:uncharacterized membrane protein